MECIIKKNKLTKIYLIGDNVPCISNVFACKISKSGKMSDKIKAIYYRQHDNFKLLTDNIPKIKSKYRRHLQHLMCHKYLYIRDAEKLPNVDKYLDNPNKYVEKQPSESIEISELIRTQKI